MSVELVAARALETIDIAMIICDARADDMPIIFANPAFEKLTLYPGSETIGRNCRFLQGEATKLGDVAKMRRALASGRRVHTCLHNYRKDRSLFLNELVINAIRNRKGEIIHFVGSQRSAEPSQTDRLRMDAAERLALLSKREREVFEALVRGTPIRDYALMHGLSTRTVEKYRSRMQAKMQTSSLPMLVRYAMAMDIEF